MERDDRVRVGVNPLIWMNDDDPSIGADISIERCLTEASTVGYAGIELGRRFPRTAEELGPLLEAYSLALVSGWYGARLLTRDAVAEHAAMESHLALLHALRVRTIVFAEVGQATYRRPRPMSMRPVLEPAHWRKFTRNLDALARRLRDEGFELAYHHHMGTVVQSPTEIERLLDDTSDAVGLTLDTGHLAWGALDEREDDTLGHMTERFAERVRHVHLKDVRAAPLAEACIRDGTFLDAVRSGVFTVPGQGDAVLQPVIDALRSRSFSGWMVVEAEQDPRSADPLVNATLGHREATRLLSGELGREHAAASRSAKHPRSVGVR